jgi:hypothetical protein
VEIKTPGLCRPTSPTSWRQPQAPETVKKTLVQDSPHDWKEVGAQVKAIQIKLKLN